MHAGETMHCTPCYNLWQRVPPNKPGEIQRNQLRIPHLAAYRPWGSPHSFLCDASHGQSQEMRLWHQRGWWWLGTDQTKHSCKRVWLTWLLLSWIYMRKYIKAFAFSIISHQWGGAGGCFPLLWMTRTCLSWTVNIMTAHDLATQGARASAAWHWPYSAGMFWFQHQEN